QDNITAQDGLTGTADPNATITLNDGSSFLATVKATNSGVWTYSPPSSFTPIVHTVTASETDSAGNIGAASLTFRYDPQGPTGFSFVPDTTHLLSLEGAATALGPNISGGTGTGNGKVYALSIQVTDVMNGLQAVAPFDIVVASSGADTINLASGSH